jgi:curved DNA-binding protein CbpA
VDTADLPMQEGRINNRNKFVLGPSGSGKSFLMNNIIEQYLTYNYDVVIVDTGDSYSGTARYKNGKYIQYTEEKPITMNPFVMDKEEFNIEKIEFLGNLIFLIWQGADSSMTTTQKSILDNLLLAYYHQFFNGGTTWFEHKTSRELILYLNKYNIYEEELYADFENQFSEDENYYHILGIPMSAEKDEIKKAFRKLAIQFHPDKNMGNEDYDDAQFDRIHQAYDTLSNDEKRKAYDETQLVLSNREITKRPQINTQEWENEFRKSLIKKVTELEEKLFVAELSFNSFYEYAEKFLPIYLSNKKFRIAENEFNLRTFLYVLADFYKGGRYGTTLNESADNSLFDEPFIVFEIDNVKDNPKLFPIVTLIIMDTFIQKMRLRKDRRKALIIEEAWKAIASKLMGGYILYLYKTVRKFWGEAVVVTQELDDIIGNAIVKDSIINNSDTFILLDQTKFIDNFDKIAQLLSLNEVEQSKIFTINNLNNKSGRSRFKEFYLKRGSKGEVYGNEVSLQQYLTYTTEKPEKSAIEYYVQAFGNYQDALEHFVQDIETLKDGLPNLVALVNLYQKPIDKPLIDHYHAFRNHNKGKDFFKVIKRELLERDMNLQEFIQTKHKPYEKV